MCCEAGRDICFDEGGVAAAFAKRCDVAGGLYGAGHVSQVSQRYIIVMDLFDAWSSRGVRLRNRIAVSPMCEYSSEDGYANDWHLVHLGSRAAGGAALVIFEAAAVSPEGRITAHDLGIYRDGHVEKLRQIVNFVHGQEALAGMQLAHAGRKASMSRPWVEEHLATSAAGGWPDAVVGPSALAFSDSYAMPVALDADGIAKVRADFVAAARRSQEAGFDVLELHAAHGYLLHEFLSPLSNMRTDEYGGCFENRTRLVREVAADLRGIWQGPLFVRISATDWVDDQPSWTVDDSVELSRILKGLGVDLMDVSSGGLVPGVKIPLGPGYQVPFAQRIREEAGIATGAVGLITDAAQADHIVRTGQADLVLLAREMLRDPYWPLHAARELGKEVRWPPQYLRAMR